MTISIHPSTQEQYGDVILNTIDKLRYGTIVVNQAGQRSPVPLAVCPLVDWRHHAALRTWW
jgi:hypothetical protein